MSVAGPLKFYFIECLVLKVEYVWYCMLCKAHDRPKDNSLCLQPRKTTKGHSLHTCSTGHGNFGLMPPLEKLLVGLDLVS